MMTKENELLFVLRIIDQNRQSDQSQMITAVSREDLPAGIKEDPDLQIPRQFVPTGIQTRITRTTMNTSTLITLREEGTAQLTEVGEGPEDRP